MITLPPTPFNISREYEKHFGAYPGVTIVHISKEGAEAFIKACRNAIDTDTALTREEALKIEHKYNAHLYEKGKIRLT